MISSWSENVFFLLNYSQHVYWFVIVTDADVNSRHSKRLANIRRITSGIYVPMLTELGQFRFRFPRS